MISNGYKIAALAGLLAMGAVGAVAYAIKTDLLPWRAWTELVRAPVERVDSDEIGTVLVTGSNSGIGLEFAKQYAAKGWTVIATHRRDTIPESLQSLSSQYGNVMIERLDLLDHDGIDALAAKLQGTPIDILINNAGILVSGDRSKQSFGTLDYSEFDLFIHTNALGPIKMAESFLPHIESSNAKKIINIRKGETPHPMTIPRPGMNEMMAKATKSNIQLNIRTSPCLACHWISASSFSTSRGIRAKNPRYARMTMAVRFDDI